MRCAAQWQAWRTKNIPFAESILLRPVAPTRRCPERIARWFPNARRHSTTVGSSDETLPISTPDERVAKFFRHGVDQLYPRYEASDNALTTYKFRTLYHELKDGEAKDEQCSITGRISAIRASSSRLFFFDITQNGNSVQAMCNHTKLSDRREFDKTQFKERCKAFARGDLIKITGHAYRTDSGELSIRATEIPELLSPCLQPFPVDEFDRSEKDKQGLAFADRHVQLLSTKKTMDTLLCRHTVIRSIRKFLQGRAFEEINTPILSTVASGAVARPFETSASEFPERRLALRIAPELWLKRLILGGFERVFEIGPSFRNEGLDKTHNPEFTTCEFYKTYTTIDELMQMTEEMLRYIQERVYRGHFDTKLTLQKASTFEADFPRLEFIPSLENALGLRLPDLSDIPTAESALLRIFSQKAIPVPKSPNLPRLLDKLSSVYLEPRCDRPTFIIHHPECLSPLSKSFVDPKTGQRVSARAELFINNQEIVNMYEEENSPFEQRKQFEMQRLFTLHARELSDTVQPSSPVESNHQPPVADPEEAEETLEIDESYLEALEWGLPPTGGWGCGVDRLVMLFTGHDRIADVLPFGNLRAVTKGAEKRGGL